MMKLYELGIYPVGTNLNPIFNVRWHLYRKLLNRVENIIGADNAEIRKYRESYLLEFKNTSLWQVSSRKNLLASLKKSTMAFIGDFHALRQSQRTHLRILQGLIDFKVEEVVGTKKGNLNSRLSPRSNLILAVEFLCPDDNEIVAAFLSSAISEADFLNEIKWNEKWGFPWENYKVIFEFCREQGIAIFGINKASRHKARHSLRGRDQFSVRQLVKIRKEHPGNRIVVIYGDLHLGKNHLIGPLKQILSDEKICVVHQNSDALFFKLVKDLKEHKIDVLQKGKSQFCILSVPPWVKWQNYLNFLEGQSFSAFDSDEILDFTDQVNEYIELLKSDLKIKIEAPHFSIYTIEDEELWAKFANEQTGGELSENDLRYIEHLIENSSSFYWPKISKGYMAKASVNHVSRIAMAALYEKVGGYDYFPRNFPKDFTRLIFLEAILFWGSKIINPKRKTNTIQDLKLFLYGREKKGLARDVLRLALARKMFEIEMATGKAKNKRFRYRPQFKQSYLEASRLLGGMLGEKIYLAYRLKQLSKNQILDLLREPIGGPEFDKKYDEIVTKIQIVRDPYLSKKEKL